MNDPYPNQSTDANVLYTSFSERPKHLDPAQSYSAPEWEIINQVYEPPLQYHYLIRPYTLVPLSTTEMPVVSVFDKSGKKIDNPFSENVAYTTYDIAIIPNVLYQPHPAFAKDKTGAWLYHDLKQNQLKHIHSLQDFKATGTRELVAEDFVYQIKRLCDPTLNSPILGLMQNYILGLEDFQKKLKVIYEKGGVTADKSKFMDLRPYPLKGAEVIDKYHYRITIKGYYPQFQYWLAMPFFSPVPWEAVSMYSQQGLVDKNITLDWYPVGTGPFMLTENNPNQRMVLRKNPNFHGELFPSIPADRDDLIYAELAKKPLPFVDGVIFSLEKESIPYWNKFLQGYYDQSGISSDNFDGALQYESGGGFDLTPDLKKKEIKLQKAPNPSVFYWGFNMLDTQVGGYTESARKLRQAISIAFDVEEYIQIFANGRAMAAQSPLPPGIFGFEWGVEGMNPFVYENKGNKIHKKPISVAKKLLFEAGYPNGVNPKTNEPLVLHLDVPESSGPDSQAIYAWTRKQFDKLGIDLVIRATQYNRFQDKIKNGSAQLFFFGWNADYPDPENFLFLLYGPESAVHGYGMNSSNYQNPEFDRLYKTMKALPNGAARQDVITRMLRVAQKDAPWIWGMHPETYALSHGWVYREKPNTMSRNTLKYIKIDPLKRARMQKAWNHAIVWPMGVVVLLLVISWIPALALYYRKTRVPPTIRKKQP